MRAQGDDEPAHRSRRPRRRAWRADRDRRQRPLRGAVPAALHAAFRGGGGASAFARTGRRARGQEVTADTLHGWLIVDKPVGVGSTQVVGAVKRALREGDYPKVKVGHGGTLDPLASGVLPVALGEATKLSGRMLGADKQYEFTLRFGEETDTLDAEGEVKIGRASCRGRGDIGVVDVSGE